MHSLPYGGYFMKKILFIVLMLFIAACGSNADSAAENAANDVPVEEDQTPADTVIGTAPAETEPEDSTIKVGFMGPLSGDIALFGENTKNGVEMALVDSQLQNVEIIYEDSKCDPKESVSIINKFVAEGVVAIVGDTCSGSALAAAPIAKENGVVMVSASATSPEITKESHLYRTIPSDALQGEFAANIIYENELESLGILYVNDDYGLGLNNVLTEAFEALGGEVVASESFERASVDVRTQVAKVRNARPDAVYIVSNSIDSSLAVLQQIEELGVTSVVYASEGLKSQEVIDGAGQASEGLRTTSVTSGTSTFREQYLETFSEEPGLFVAQGYDAGAAIFKAIQAGATTKETVIAQLTTLQFEGATGTIDFDEDGDVAGNYDVFEVVNGTFVLVE